MSDQDDSNTFENRLAHYCFAQPPRPGISVWRYMNLAKYVSLLQSRTLFLTRLDRFSDPLEGTLPRIWVDLMTQWLKEQNQGTFDDLRPLYKKMRHSVFASCWHINNFESEAMWRLYGSGDGGIAVQTTYENLAESIRHVPQGFIGLVKYIDYNSALFPDNNALHPLMHKRVAFQHEREVRVVRWHTEHINEVASAPEAMELPWDIRRFAHAVYVDPSAQPYFYAAVKAVTEAFAPELVAKLQWSKMKEVPIL